MTEHPSPFSHLRLFTLDDDDRMFDGVAPMSAVALGPCVYFRRSDWPYIKEELQQLSRLH